MKQASDTYVTSVPESEISPEEQMGLVVIPDLKLRRTNPKRFDVHQDWYSSNGEHEDTSISNRYDNSQPLSASLKLSWEEDASFKDLINNLRNANYVVRVFNRKDTRRIDISKINSKTQKVFRDSSLYLDEVKNLVFPLFPEAQITIEKYYISSPKFIEVVIPLQRQNISKEDVIKALALSGLPTDVYYIRKKTGGWAVILYDDLSKREVLDILSRLQVYYPEASFLHSERHYIFGTTFMHHGGFYIPLRIIESSLASLEQLDWEIECYVEGSSFFKASSLHLFSFEDLLLKRRQAYLQSIGNIIIYKDFAQDVKDFVDEKFKDLLDRHPEAREHLNSLSLEFTLRPKDYRNNIGAEYYPETKTIGYYLPKETLKKNWAGVVHEIVHALQDFFQDSEPSLVSPPEVTASYMVDRSVYRADRGEEQAYAIEYEFKQWVINHANS